MKDTNTIPPAHATPAKRLVTIQVEMTATHAARIERLAALLRRTPGDLIAQLSLAELDGWRVEPTGALWSIYRNRRFAKSTGAGLEALLVGGRSKMRLAKLVSLAERAGVPDGDPKGDLYGEVKSLIAAGEKIMAQRPAA